MDSDDTTSSESVEEMKKEISEIQKEIEWLNECLEKQGDEMKSQLKMIKEISEQVDGYGKQLENLSEEINEKSKSIVDQPDNKKQSGIIGLIFSCGVVITLYRPILPFSGPIWDVFSTFMVGAAGSIFFIWGINSKKFQNM